MKWQISAGRLCFISVHSSVPIHTNDCWLRCLLAFRIFSPAGSSLIVFEIVLHSFLYILCFVSFWFVCFVVSTGEFDCLETGLQGD